MNIATQQETAELDNVPPPTLKILERQTIAFLYAIWRAQGDGGKRIVRVESVGHLEDIKGVKDGQTADNTT